MIIQKEVKMWLGLSVILFLLAAAIFVSREDAPQPPITDDPDAIAALDGEPLDGGDFTIDDTPGSEDTRPDYQPGESIVIEDGGEPVDDGGFTTGPEVEIIDDSGGIEIIEDDGSQAGISEDIVVDSGFPSDDGPITIDDGAAPDIEIIEDTPVDTRPIDPYPAYTPPVETGGSEYAGGMDYTIKRGDSYGKIAKDIYGDFNLWTEVYKANPSVPETEMMPGNKIYLPRLKKKQPKQPKAEEPVIAEVIPTNVMTHVVKGGETLGGISRKYYGTVTKWKDILKANPKVKDEYNVYVGLRLVIPGVAPKDETEDLIPDLRDIGTAAPAAGSFSKTHIVREGETLWSIAETYFGNGIKYKDIQAANPGLRAERMYIGKVINIPGLQGSSSGGTGSGYFLYTIKSGDTLGQIASDLLGAQIRWREIQAMNPGLQPSRMPVGKQIKVPTSGAVPGSISRSQSAPRRDDAIPELRFDEPVGTSGYLASGRSTSPSGGGTTYKVRAGDTLQKISQKFYGTTLKWGEIQKANPRIRDEYTLYVGMELKIPAISGTSSPAPRTSIPEGTVRPTPRRPQPTRRHTPSSSGRSYMEGGRSSEPLMIESFGM